MKTLNVEQRDGITWVTLNRPEVRNAFNDVMIGELAETIGNLSIDTRTVVLAGNGKVFCAGADIEWMRSSRNHTPEQNIAGARRMSEMLGAIDTARCPVIARVHGAALGGGVGLISCCDIVIAEPSCKLGFTEVRLGLLPAVISPFALRKIGENNARRYFLTGEVFDAKRGMQLGLVHEVVALDELDATVEKLCQAIVANGPKAVVAAKELIREVRDQTPDEARDYTSQRIATLRALPEGQEGLNAFLEKRKPSWQ